MRVQAALAFEQALCGRENDPFVAPGSVVAASGAGELSGPQGTTHPSPTCLPAHMASLPPSLSLARSLAHGHPLLSWRMS